MTPAPGNRGYKWTPGIRPSPIGRVGVGLTTLLITAWVSLSATPNEEVFPNAKGSLRVIPIQHATFALEWNGRTIFVDPVGGSERFNGLDRPDLILVTDIHGDHLNLDTLKGVLGDATRMVAPKAVADQLPQSLQGRLTVLNNGQTETVAGVRIEAIPAYNTTPERKRYHPVGRGNGYVLSLAGQRIYISGDTEDIPEMRRLRDIDVALICMNLPYTMTVEQAASAVREFKPKVVYPYHYRGSDLERFESLLEPTSDVEVRIRDWYPR